jgi:pilin isopeptide linkage protein
MITGSGVSKFGTWSYKKAGTYFYKVSEVNTGEKGYTYDTTVYTITDTVTEANGKLVQSRVIVDNLNKRTESLNFKNKYNNGPGGNGGNNGKGFHLPKTGDYTNIMLFTVLLVIGGAAAAGLTIYLAAGKKRKTAAAERHIK